MKKIFSVLLVLVMILGLAACGSDDKEETTTAAQEETTTAAAADETTAAKEETTAAPSGGDTEEIHEIYLVEDRNCLNGLISPNDLVDRSDIEKALPTEPREGLLCGIEIASLRNTYYVEVQNTCTSTCEGYGYSVNCLIAEDSVDRMVANIDTFITQGCDVIGVNGDVTVLTQISTTCIEAGIPIIGISAISEEPTHMITTISASDFLNGFSAGERAGHEMKDFETIHAVYIPGMAGFTMCDSRGCGTVAGIVYARLQDKGEDLCREDAMLIAYNMYNDFILAGSAEIPEAGLIIHGYVEGGFVADQGLAAMEDLLTMCPECNLVFCDNDYMACGALLAVQATDRVAGEDIYIIASADGTNMAMRNIMEGNILCTGGSSPATLGSGVGQLIHMVFHDMFEANNLPEVTFAPNLLISKDNVDKYFIEDYDYAAPDPMVFQTVDEARAEILGN